MQAPAAQAFSSIKSIIDSLYSVVNLDLLGEQVNKLLTMYFPAEDWLLLTKESDEENYTIRSAVVKKRTKRRLHNTEVTIKTGLLKNVIDSGGSLYVPIVKKDPRFNDENDVVLGIEEIARDAFFTPLSTNKSKNVIGLLALYNVKCTKNIEYYTCFSEAISSAIVLVINYLCSIRDLKRKALTDHLTGLHNRRALVSIVEREIEQCLRYDRYMSFVLIDVDHFKQINDTDGHLHGDAVLVRLAQILQKSVRRLDYVIRFAGDEFIILMSDTLEPQKSEVIRRLRENFERDKLPSSVPYSISIGSYSGPPQSLQHMFDKADQEMYRQKKNKKQKRATAVPHAV